MSDLKIIASYTRREALEDGIQIEIDTKTRKAAGINYPVFFTQEVWDKYVLVPEELKGWQDQEGRLWDILFMFAWKARRVTTSYMTFEFAVQLPDKGDWTEYEKRGENSKQRIVTLASTIGANDLNDASPAITIMLPNQD